MNTACRYILILTVALMFGCEPEDQTPGLWLSGDLVQSFPDDWSFSSGFGEIAIEVSTPYFIPHSVTIWCVDVEGDLFVAASAADEKSWPGWVDDDPNVVLKVGDKIYEASLVPVVGEVATAPIRAAYAAKYKLGGSQFDPGSKYWSVRPSTD